MRSILVTTLLVTLFFMTTTIGGMTLVGMTHQMDMDGSYVPEMMVCLDHCLNALAPESVAPMVLTFLLIIVMFTFGSSREQSGVRREYHFGRWRQTIATFLRHQRLSTVVLLD